jgi:hypothetical protein
MNETHASTEHHHQPELYEIRVAGHLDSRWADRFEGLSFTHESDGTTILYGPVVDQAALHGLLRKVRDLGLPLVSVAILSKPDKTDPNERDKEKGLSLSKAQDNQIWSGPAR